MYLRILYILMGLCIITACSSKHKRKPPAETNTVWNHQSDPSINKHQHTQDNTSKTVRQQPIEKQASPYNNIVQGSVADFQLNIGDRVFFDYDSFSLTEKAKNILKRQANWLDKYPSLRIEIAGNCDERGTREYNLALGARRAESAKSYLISQGVAPYRITTISYGKERPVNPESNPAAWSVNRNAHTQLKQDHNTG